MRYAQIIRSTVLASLATIALSAACVAATPSYNVVINTSPLVGHPAGPFYLFFALTDGSGLSDGNNTVTINNFDFSGGSILGNPSSLGGVTGDLGSAISITDAGTLNLFSEAFSAGQSLRFRVTVTNNADDGPIPDGFAFYILDSFGRPIPTLSPGSNYFISLGLGVSGAMPLVFGSDTSRPPSVGNPISIAPPTVTPVDTVPPITVALLSPQANAAGWDNTNVVLTLNSTDNETNGTGVKQITYSGTGAQTIQSTVVQGASASITINKEGVTTITFFGTDNANNVESAKAITIQLDKTPPIIRPALAPPSNVNDWNNTNVTVSFQCSDTLSGLAAGSPPAATVLSSEGAGQSVTGTCTDVAGNSASATVSGINIDKTPPTVACTADPNVLWPPNNKLVRINLSVNVTDALSGFAGFMLVSVTGNEPDIGLGDIQGFSIGTASTSGQLRAQRLGSGNGRVYTFVYGAADRAGNNASCATTVTVPHDQGN